MKKKQKNNFAFVNEPNVPLFITQLIKNASSKLWAYQSVCKQVQLDATS